MLGVEEGVLGAFHAKPSKTRGTDGYEERWHGLGRSLQVAQTLLDELTARKELPFHTGIVAAGRPADIAGSHSMGDCSP